MTLHPVLRDVTNAIIARSDESRKAFLQKVEKAAAQQATHRSTISCSNFAHGFAACAQHEKDRIRAANAPNIGIITAYNDMLSAHEPYQHFPAIIKEAIYAAGGTAQVAGGVPAMCDGITQGQAGMELSLFSRDIIAMSTAIALSHHMFDGVICLGTCDKIVPGLLMGALQFAHLPVIFTPAGPMPSGMSHTEKLKVREAYAQGKVGEDALLEAEAQSYGAAGTCNFYGTANSNQLLLEIMGLQLPGGTFVAPYTELRDALTRHASTTVLEMTKQGARYTPLYKIITEKTMVNAIVALLASGGSTNHTIHLIAIARAAGIRINWDDMDALAKVVPLLCSIYPNGEKDINALHTAGGVPVLVQTLLDHDLLHDDVETMRGKGLRTYALQQPELDSAAVKWKKSATTSGDASVLRDVKNPFRPEGGIRCVSGNLGRAVVKTSALKSELLHISAPCRIFTTQEQVIAAFKAGDLHKDLVVVLLGQGPAANGMPELHALMPSLGTLIGLGYKIALVTDGRLSGASSKVPAAIHVTPEALRGEALRKLHDGDVITLDIAHGVLKADVPDNEWQARAPRLLEIPTTPYGFGTELFSSARHAVSVAEEGASFIV